MRHAVILAGGSGDRFWPLSQKDHPKQFLPLAGDHSLLRDTFLRLVPVIPPERIWVVTAQAQARKVARELPELSRANILKEPLQRNTAPALYLAALAVLRKDPDPTLLILPADAWVPKAKAYQKACRDAMNLAQSGGQLVLVGVQPTRVETGYGHIEPGAVLGTGPGKTVRRFVEKPSLPVARRLVRGGRHLWNCGIFAWEAKIFCTAVEDHLPRLARAMRPLQAGRWTKERLNTAYAKAPRISVDYGVLEPAKNVAVIPAGFLWDDLGSWRALERLGPKGSRRGEVLDWDSPGLIAWAETGTVAVIGVPDVVVVHTPLATLVVAKDRAQEVRKVAEKIRSKTDKR